MKYGYIRVSTKEQNPQRQQEAMEREGVDRVLVDYASGKDFDRPKYSELMGLVRPGDKIVVDSLDRLGRDYDGLIAEWKSLTHDKGVHVQALDLPFMDSEYFAKLGDLGKLVEDLFLGILAWVAEHERLEMKRRQEIGIAKAKEQGKYKGRMRLSYPPETLAAASDALAVGGKAAAARVLGCSVGTVSNMLKDGRLSHAAA